MTSPAILIVEDNPITRKMVRVALQGEGYDVFEAEDGQSAIELMATHAIDLVLQDLLLPDMDGFDLIHLLRALPGGADIPILALSGFLSQEEQARGAQACFTDYLFKPVEPSRLLDMVRAYLQPPREEEEKPGGGRRVLLADDDPIQLKLLALYLGQLGFEVIPVADGGEALEQARRCTPDAIVSDVLMPQLDGFRLCEAVKQDAQLRHIPVVLTSSAYTEEADRRLAQTVGASALVLRTPDCAGVIQALLASLNDRASTEALVSTLEYQELVEVLMTRPKGEWSALPSGPVELTEEYTYRVIRQLEHQASLNASLSGRLAVLEAKLAILAGLAETLKHSSRIDTVLDDLLHHSLNAAGVSQGAAYLLTPEGELTLQAQLGYSGDVEAELPEFFGHADILHCVLEAGEPLRVVPVESPEAPAGELLERAGVRSLLMTPLVLGEERLGVMVMSSENRELGEEWEVFARAVGIQIGQAIGLARAFSDLKANEERLARIVKTIPDGILILGQEGQIAFANAAAEALLGLTPSGASGLSTVASGDRLPGAPEPMSFARIVRLGEVVFGEEVVVEHPDGSRVLLELNAAPMRDGDGALIGMVASLTDITQRRQAEEELEAAQQRLLQSEVEKKQFYREVIRAVTNDKLHLVDAGEIPMEGRRVLDVSCQAPVDCRVVRHQLKEVAEGVALSPEGVDDLILAVGEGTTNAVKHGSQGRCQVYATHDRLIARISDKGCGIQAENLPASLLLPGFSTKISLGLGYTLMLKLVDRIWLATGPEGTVVQLEKWIRPEEFPRTHLFAA